MTLTPIKAFFEKSPLSKDLFDVLVVSVITRFPETTIQLESTQIALVSTHPYAAVWCPLKVIKGHPHALLILSLGLDRELKDPRIFEVSHPYPNRWMFHLLIEKKEDIDEKLLHMLSLAYDFSLRSSRNIKS